MKKKDYKSWVAKFGLEFFDWLTYLPCSVENEKTGEYEPCKLTNPVPIVHLPVMDLSEMAAKIKEHGFHFADSTILCVEGYHIPKGHCTRAFVKDVSDG